MVAAVGSPLEPSVRLRRADWEVRTVELRVAQDLVRRLHYSGGGSNTATYRHGLFRKGHDECLGVAWWIPPTKTAAKATWPADWQGVLALTRLAIEPEVPKNGASFLLGKSMAAIDRSVITKKETAHGYHGYYGY